jgi:hypothetical protein
MTVGFTFWNPAVTLTQMRTAGTVASTYSRNTMAQITVENNTYADWGKPRKSQNNLETDRNLRRSEKLLMRRRWSRGLRRLVINRLDTCSVSSNLTRVLSVKVQALRWACPPCRAILRLKKPSASVNSSDRHIAAARWHTSSCPWEE